MDDCITIKHELPHFHVSREPYLITNKYGKKLYVTEGYSDNPYERTCPKCGHKMYIHGSYVSTYQDIELNGHLSLIKVKLMRTCCPKCKHSSMQEPGFTSMHHMLTERLERRIRIRINNGAGTVETSRSLSVHPSIIKDIDLRRLESLHMDHHPPCKYIGIDEFKLHDGHKYATVAIDLATGHILFVEAGKKKQQAYDFFEQMGPEWMRQVVAVSMDMNAQYDSAFKEKWPHIRIVYDSFHLIKLYNDTVLSRMRKRIQNEYRASGDDESYKTMKNSRFLIISNLSTILMKDREAGENNLRLREEYINKGKPLPPGERLMRVDRKWRLDKIFEMNKELGLAYYLLDQFKYAYSLDNKYTLAQGIDDWCKIAEQSEIPEVLAFRETVLKHRDGIVNHAIDRISSGKVEGTNNLIKTVRRKAYGYTDTHYFFLKIMYESRKQRLTYRSNKSHNFLN